MINRQPDQTNDDQLALTINNGDLAALRAIKDKFGLRDEEAVFRFALALFTQSAQDTVYIKDDTGARIGISPSNILRREQSGEDGQQDQ